MLKTVSQATASLTFTIGAFAVPLVLFLSGGPSFAVDRLSETVSYSAPALMTPTTQPRYDGAVEAPMLESLETQPEMMLASSASPRKTGARKVGTPSSPSSSARAAPASQTATKQQKKKRECLPDNPNIDQLGTSEFAIDRGLIKYYRGNLKALNGLGRASTDKVDGKSQGFVVKGIQCGNDLHQAGLRNGDVINAVNGKAITNIPQAIAVYLTQSGKEEITLSITRKGARKQISYLLG